MKNYDLLIIETSGEVRFKRLSNNNTKGIIELFKENNLLDDIDEMYFIQITIQDEKDILKLKKSFKLVGDSLEFCNILAEGNILFVYKKALEEEMMNLMSKHKFEDAVELKTTSKALTAIINSEDSNEEDPTGIWIENEDGSETDYELSILWDNNIDYWQDINILEDNKLPTKYYDLKYSDLPSIIKETLYNFLMENKDIVLNLIEDEDDSIVSFAQFNENKHKGKQVSPKIIWHKSVPFFRDKIDKEGLKVMKGDSYMSHSPEKSSPPAIFGYFGDIDYYDSTYDDDIWEIDTTKIPNVQWFIDKEVGVDVQLGVVTYQNIPRNAIKLIYKGTEEDVNTDNDEAIPLELQESLFRLYCVFNEISNDSEFDNELSAGYPFEKSFDKYDVEFWVASYINENELTLDEQNKISEQIQSHDKFLFELLMIFRDILVGIHQKALNTNITLEDNYPFENDLEMTIISINDWLMQLEIDSQDLDDSEDTTGIWIENEDSSADIKETLNNFLI